MSEGAHRSILRREAILTSAGGTGSVALSAIASVIIARSLGVTGRGVSSAVLALSALCGTVATGGVAGGLSYAYGRARPDVAASLARAGSLAALALAVLGAGIFLVAQAIHRTPGLSDSEVALAAVVAGSYVVQHVVLNLSLTAASLRWYAAAQVLPAIFVVLATAAIALVFGLTVLSVIAVSAAGSAIGAGTAIVGLRRCGAYGSGRLRVRPGHIVRTLRPFAGYSMMIFATMSMTQIVQRLDIVLVADLKNAHAAGLYAVAAQVGDLVLVLPAALGALVFRRGAQGAASHARDATRAMRWTLVVSLITAGIFAVLARFALELVVGRRYDGAVAPLRLLLPGLVALSVQTVVSGYIVSRGYAGAALRAWGVAAVAGVIADVVVIPRFGITGAAIVSSASYGLVLVLHLGALRQARRAEAIRPPTLVADS